LAAAVFPWSFFAIAHFVAEGRRWSRSPQLTSESLLLFLWAAVVLGGLAISLVFGYLAVRGVHLHAAWQALQASKPLDEQLLGRAVSIRTIYLDSVRNDPPTVSYARWLTVLGGQVRTVPVLPLRLIVFDRSVAVVPLDPNVTRAGVTLLPSPGAVAAMHALFEQVWENATPLGVAQPRVRQNLTRQDAALLRLLSQGDTDEMVARKLGVSVRTVRRMASELMAELGARSRFQAGVLAYERGWLDPGIDLSSGA